MSNFNRYAQFYDLFYQKKDYKRESEFVFELLKNLGLKKPRRILDVGCGTGGHVLRLAEKGFHVDGIDLSADMVKIAASKIKKARLGDLASVSVGDIRKHVSEARYDLVIAMFAVIGYLTETKHLISAFKNIETMLQEYGAFVFDVWFGPTVLNDLPGARINEFSSGESQILRLVEPELDVRRQVVNVHYRILETKGKSQVDRIDELHVMRYFFIQELELMLQSAGLRLAHICPFLDSSREPKLGDWNISVVATKLRDGKELSTRSMKRIKG